MEPKKRNFHDMQWRKQVCKSLVHFLGNMVHSFVSSFFLCTVSNFGKTRTTDEVPIIITMLPYNHLKIYCGNLGTNASPTLKGVPVAVFFSFPVEQLN